MATVLEKVSFHSYPKETACNECSDYQQLHSSHTLAKECSKSPSLQQQANRELLDAHVGFRKHRVSRQQIANNCWITEKAREFQRNMKFSFTEYGRALDCMDHNKLENA